MDSDFSEKLTNSHVKVGVKFVAKQIEDSNYIGPPALTPEDAEDELISMAIGLARQRLADGTASNQLIAEVIKMGTTKERLQKEKLRRENEMLKAKTEAIKSQKHAEELASNAIKAFRSYSGVSDDEEDYYEY